MLPATAQRIEPTAKIAAVMRIARFRPRISVRRPLRIEPQTAPTRAALTNTSSENGLSPNAPLMKRIAPEMTPVSKPKRRQANAAVPATIFTKGPVGFAPENLVVCVIDSISQLVVRNYSVLFLRGGRSSAVVVNDDPRTALLT